MCANCACVRANVCAREVVRGGSVRACLWTYARGIAGACVLACFCADLARGDGRGDSFRLLRCLYLYEYGVIFV